MEKKAYARIESRFHPREVNKGLNRIMLGVPSPSRFIRDVIASELDIGTYEYFRESRVAAIIRKR